MAIDAYMYFQDYNGAYQLSESQVDAKVNPKDVMWKDYHFSDAQSATALFEVEDFSFDIEQTLSIGSQSSGSGAGKVTFNQCALAHNNRTTNDSACNRGMRLHVGFRR